MGPNPGDNSEINELNAEISFLNLKVKNLQKIIRVKDETIAYQKERWAKNQTLLLALSRGLKAISEINL